MSKIFKVPVISTFQKIYIVQSQGLMFSTARLCYLICNNSMHTSLYNMYVTLCFTISCSLNAAVFSPR